MKKRKTEAIDQCVGKETYAMWIDMLRTLVPGGRTHRVRVVVAGMLQYAEARHDWENPAHRVLFESGNYERAIQTLLPVIEKLFLDAKVQWIRTNAAGREYSIAYDAAQTCLSWDDMPWE